MERSSDRAGREKRLSASERILRATAQCIAAKGVAEVSMQDVADAGLPFHAL